MGSSFGVEKVSPSIVHTPSAVMSAMYQVLPSGEILTSCGIAPWYGSFCCPTTFIRAVSTFSSSPENSQETMK